MEESIIRTTLRVPRELWKKVRNAAINAEKDVNDLVVEALREKYG